MTGKEIEWLLPKIREIWSNILSFEVIFEDIPNVKLDLKFLIDLEKQGYKVLKYYKFLHNNNSLTDELQDTVQQEFTVNELKLLLSQVYQFYAPSSHHTETEQLMRSNPYYKCFIKHVVGADKLLVYLKKEKNWN